MLLRAASAQGPVENIVLTAFEKNAPIVKDLEFYQKSGSADSLKRARTTDTKTKITRSINEPNVAPAPVNNYDPVLKKIVSFDAKVDVILEDRNEDPELELAHQTKIEAEEAAWVFAGNGF